MLRGDRPPQGLPGELGHDAQETLFGAVMRGQVDLVVDLVGPNYVAHVGGGPPGTLLHHACWIGSPEVVGRLLERGADPIARSGAEYDTPVGWAALGSAAWREPGRDYVAVVEQLVAAGAELEPRFLEVAEGPFADWLEGRI